MPYYYNENGKKEYTNGVKQGIAYTSDGYLLPCCWCDAPSTRKDFVDLGMYNEGLKLSNNESVISIISSNIWKKFINTIMLHPSDAPKCCREKCGVTND